MAQRIAEDRPIAVQQRIDGVGAGVAHEVAGADHGLRPLAEPAGRKPIERRIEDQEHQQAEDVNRKGPAENGEDTDDVVRPAVEIDTRARSQEDGQQQAGNEGQHHQFQRRWKQ
ncbi:hypothetical protein D3C72_1991150 [compost metagenome]